MPLGYSLSSSGMWRFKKKNVLGASRISALGVLAQFNWNAEIKKKECPRREANKCPWGTRSVQWGVGIKKKECPRREMNKCPWGTRSVQAGCGDLKKCPRRESNAQPSAPQAGALSIKLRGRYYKTCDSNPILDLGQAQIQPDPQSLAPNYRGNASVKTMMVYNLCRVIVYTFILQIHHLRSVDHHRSDMLFLK